MFEHETIAVLSISQCSEVARMDASTQKYNPFPKYVKKKGNPKETIVSKDYLAREKQNAEEYVRANTLTYYVLSNTWVLLWQDYAQYAWVRLVEEITSKGLLPTIELMQQEAMRILRGEPLGPWGTVLQAEVQHRGKNNRSHLNSTMVGLDVDATVLTLLRYPKRFSPVGNERIQHETLLDFAKFEKRTKRWQRSCSYGYNYAIGWVRQVIREMYDWDKICDEIESMTPQDISFSSGAAINAKPNLGDKYLAVLRDGNHADFQLPIFGTYLLPRYGAHVDGVRTSEVRAVPKTYKSSRIIAMEEVYPIAKGKAIEKIFRKHDRAIGLINLEDQSINQRYAQEGSVTGDIASLDASHASDLISKTLWTDVLPKRYTRLVRSLLPERVRYHRLDMGQVTMPLQMASTSGHTLTFRHETIIYYAVVEAAVRITELFGGTCAHRVAHAYGDDTLVSTEAYEVAVWLFTRLGLIINRDKSYASGRFRESCGEDYMDGVPVTSIYYPRFPVLGTISSKGVRLDDSSVFRDEYRGKLDNSVTMLIDLQKKLFPHSYGGARFLASIVRTAYPSITTSVAGTICNDLWDLIDTGKAYVPGTYSVENVGRYKTWPRVLAAVRKGTVFDTLSGENAKTFDRLSKLDTLHKYPSVSFESSNEFTDEQELAYAYFKYTFFLRYGPRYEDSLLKSLGISQAPPTLPEFFGRKVLRLKTNR
jgi:hypothetical protein